MKEGVSNLGTIKPQEVLDRQQALSNFDDNHEALPHLETPERLDNLSPEDFVAEVRLMRKEVKDFLPNRHQLFDEFWAAGDREAATALYAHDNPGNQKNIEDINALDTYNEYVARLRALRQRQQEHIRETIENAEKPEDRRELLLRAVSWAGPLQEKILEDMQASRGWEGRRTLTDVQVHEAAQSEEGFLEKVRQLASQSPRQLFTVLEPLSTLLPHQEYVSLVKHAVTKQPGLLMRYAHDVRGVLGDDAYVQLFVTAAAERTLSRGAVMRLGKDDLLRTQLGQERVHTLIQTCVRQDPGAILEMSSVLWEEHVLDAETLNEVLATTITSSSRHDQLQIFKVIKDKLGNTGKELCDKAVHDALEKSRLFSLGALLEFEGLIDDSEVRGKARHMLLKSTNRVTVHTLEEVKRFLTDGEFSSWIRDVALGVKTNIFLSGSVEENILEADVLNQEDRSLFLQILRRDQPGVVFRNPSLFLEDIPSKQRGQTLARIVSGVPVEVGLMHLADWLPHVADSREGQRDALMSYLERGDNLVFLERYLKPVSDSAHDSMLTQTLTREDVATLLKQCVERRPGMLYTQLSHVRTFLGSDEGLKKIVESVRPVDLRAFFQDIDKVTYLYEPNELARIISEYVGVRTLTGNIFSHINAWAPHVGTETTQALVRKGEQYIAIEAHLIPKVREICPEYSTASFYETLLRTNPAAALYYGLDTEQNVYKKDGVCLDVNEVRAQALGDKTTLEYAPTYLAHFWEGLAKTIGKGDRDRLLGSVKSAAFTYLAIDAIRSQGLEETYKNIATQKKLDPESERSLLDLLASYAHYRKMWGESEQVSPLNTEDDVREALVQGTENMLEVDIQEVAGPERGRRFLETMETPGPFLSYLSQYHRSPAHKELLRGMYAAIIRGEYGVWKYGNSEDLQSFKERGWLPQQLSPEQYLAWRQTDQTGLHETFKTSADEVVREIQRTLKENSVALGVRVFDPECGDLARALEEAKANLRLVGDELATLGKQMSLIKKQPKALTETQVAELSAKKVEVERLRSVLVRNRDMARLASLSPKEILSGYLLDGEKKTQSLNDFIHDIRAHTPADGQLIVDRVVELVAGFRSSGAEKEDVVCKDVDHPKITIEIGANPVPSCQHFENGSQNECLLGYTEPNTKILIVRNSEGNIIARSILRLLSTEQGGVALQVEKVYATTASRGAVHAVLEHASKKAQLVGVGLIADLGDILEGTGFTAHEEPVPLMSRGARAPLVYVDSAQGPSRGGKYTIPNARRIVRV